MPSVPAGWLARAEANCRPLTASERTSCATPARTAATARTARRMLRKLRCYPRQACRLAVIHALQPRNRRMKNTPQGAARIHPQLGRDHLIGRCHRPANESHMNLAWINRFISKRCRRRNTWTSERPQDCGSPHGQYRISVWSTRRDRTEGVADACSTCT